MKYCTIFLLIVLVVGATADIDGGNKQELTKIYISSTVNFPLDY